MMLLIPATSIASTQKYGRYYAERERYSNYDYGYENDRYYKNEYRVEDYKETYKDKPPIIIKK